MKDLSDYEWTQVDQYDDVFVFKTYATCFPLETFKIMHENFGQGMFKDINRVQINYYYYFEWIEPYVSHILYENEKWNWLYEQCDNDYPKLFIRGETNAAFAKLCLF